ncbi:PilX N-terminal domain-containing pilus assembly protein [Marinobacter sp.]|uniref:pilus assembly PilX family protein n=1 Tax=Marinobacter sp. TaxID=50741 RepID=UPI00356B241F
MMNREKGIALLMSLIILLALSLLATSSMQNSVMQERMSNASREGLITLEAAEAALREVEDSLEGLTNLNDFGTASGWYQTGDAPAVLSDDTWSENSDEVLVANSIDGLEPKYFIEYLGRVSVLPGSMSGDRTVRNLNFEGSGDSSGGGGAAGPGDAEISIEAESMRIVVMATGPSEQSRRIIESYYFISANNIES